MRLRTKAPRDRGDLEVRGRYPHPARYRLIAVPLRVDMSKLEHVKMEDGHSLMRGRRQDRHYPHASVEFQALMSATARANTTAGK
jgi:hypothetical protein